MTIGFLTLEGVTSVNDGVYDEMLHEHLYLSPLCPSLKVLVFALSRAVLPVYGLSFTGAFFSPCL